MLHKCEESPWLMDDRTVAGLSVAVTPMTCTGSSIADSKDLHLLLRFESSGGAGRTVSGSDLERFSSRPAGHCA